MKEWSNKPFSKALTAGSTSAGLGEAAGAAIAGSSLVMGSSIVAPIAVGAAVACASIKI